jgi:hypothetical protein
LVLLLAISDSKGQYSQLKLEERNEYLQPELKVCRKKIEELKADMIRLAGELRIAEKYELLAEKQESFVITSRNFKPTLQSF